MPKVLTEDQVREFDQNGFLFPVEAYSREEAAELHARFAAIEEHLGHEPQKKFRVKAHQDLFRGTRIASITDWNPQRR